MTVDNWPSGEPGALGILAQAFRGQEGTDTVGGILDRLSRFLMGDPAGACNATSPNTTTPVRLPDLPGVKSAFLYVSDNSCFVRTDGQNPTANADLYVPQGSYIILTGVPTLKGFVFISGGGTNCNLFGSYYT